MHGLPLFLVATEVVDADAKAILEGNAKAILEGNELQMSLTHSS